MDTSAALRLLSSVGAEERYVYEFPEGFERVGSGCTRTVIRCGDVVIKLGDTHINWVEVENTKRLRSDPQLPNWCYVPEAEYVNGVCVQEYVEIEDGMPDCDAWQCECDYSPCWYERAQYIQKTYRISDLHLENCTVKLTEDGYVLIPFDLGSGCYGEYQSY